MEAWMAAARPHIQAFGGMIPGGFSQGEVLEGKLAHAVPGLQARHQGHARSCFGYLQVYSGCDSHFEAAVVQRCHPCFPVHLERRRGWGLNSRLEEPM